MPSLHTLREFSQDAYFHVYNRGVEKRTIFQSDDDRRMFLYYLFVYLAPFKMVLERYPNLPIRLYQKNLHGRVEIASFSLMPNHFHLLLRQSSEHAITVLAKQLTNAYTAYFNRKYKRVGPLMQGRFKAVRIATDELFIHTARYIHLNPVASGLIAASELADYKWASHREYLSEESKICKKDALLSFFPSIDEYEEFILDQVEYAKSLEKIKHLTLEE